MTTTLKVRMQLTAAQSRALELIKKDYCTEPFSKPYDPIAKRYVSEATLTRLHNLGLIEHVSTNKYTTSVRGLFGKGNHKSRVQYENVWRMKK